MAAATGSPLALATILVAVFGDAGISGNCSSSHSGSINSNICRGWRDTRGSNNINSIRSPNINGDYRENRVSAGSKIQQQKMWRHPVVSTAEATIRATATVCTRDQAV